MITWQSDDSSTTFEPISKCNWVEKINGVVSAKYSFVSFSNLDHTLILYDQKKKSFVILNDESYKFGRNYDSMILLDNGGWKDTKELLRTFFNKANNCQVKEEIISKAFFMTYFMYQIL